MEKLIRFSSIKDYFKKNEKELSYTMIVPFKDTYKVSFSRLEKVIILSLDKKVLVEASSSFQIDLEKDQQIIVKLIHNKGKQANIKVTPKHHKSLLPYEPIELENTRKLRVYDNNETDCLKPAKIEAIKRDDGNGLYINCNNPEKISKVDLGKALSRVDISNKKVFFTAEHNNINEEVYYGYQVKNTGNEDVYVTVLNMGFQLDGPGCWLGEREWIDFYNVNFRANISSLNEKQKETFVAYYGFCNTYKAPNNQPTTYRIPKGKYIYIMGGTTKDAYKHINVWNSANKAVKGGCSNVVVLFDVVGQAEGSFFIYQDPSQIKNNSTHQGYVCERDGTNYGVQYVGYDTCHGVVDTKILFEFNDLTPSGNLPVTYERYENKPMPENPVPYMKLDLKKVTVNDTMWPTHISTNGHDVGVGTDMTRYITVDDKGNEVIICNECLDGRAEFPNIGNWMVDYMDYYTFVNKGDMDREITIQMGCNGSILGFIRDKHGKFIKGTEKYAINCIYQGKGPEYTIHDDYIYKVTIKAHSIKQFIVDYNLLANSCGFVPHTVILK